MSTDLVGSNGMEKHMRASGARQTPRKGPRQPAPAPRFQRRRRARLRRTADRVPKRVGWMRIRYLGIRALHERRVIEGRQCQARCHPRRDQAPRKSVNANQGLTCIRYGTAGLGCCVGANLLRVPHPPLADHWETKHATNRITKGADGHLQLGGKRDA